MPAHDAAPPAHDAAAPGATLTKHRKHEHGKPPDDEHADEKKHHTHHKKHDDETPPAAREQMVIKGERHTGTNFLHAVIALNYGKDVCPGAQYANCAMPCVAHCRECAGTSSPSLRELPVAAGKKASMAVDLVGGVNEADRSCVEASMCCWKHGYASSRCYDSYSTLAHFPAHVFLVRSPYSWVVAMKNNPYGMIPLNSTDMSMHEYLRFPVMDDQWHHVDSQTNCEQPPCLANGIPYEQKANCLPDLHRSVVRLWIAKVRSYLSFSRERPLVPTVHLNSEQLYNLSRTRKQFETLVSASDRYPRAHKKGKASHEAAPPGSSLLRYPPFSSTEDKFDGRFTRAGFEEAHLYEQSKAWLELLTQADLDVINRLVPDELFRAFNLERVRKHPGEAALLRRREAFANLNTAAADGSTSGGGGGGRPLPDANFYFSEPWSRSRLRPAPESREEWHARMLNYLDEAFE